MLNNTSRSFLIQQPKLDGSDTHRFFNDVSNAMHENSLEARALERRISEEVTRPFLRWLKNKVQQLGKSAHEQRWENFYD